MAYIPIQGQDRRLSRICLLSRSVENVIIILPVLWCSQPPNLVKAYLIAPKEITLSSAAIFFGYSVNSSIIL